MGKRSATPDDRGYSGPCLSSTWSIQNRPHSLNQPIPKRLNLCVKVSKETQRAGGLLAGFRRLFIRVLGILVSAIPERLDNPDVNRLQHPPSRACHETPVRLDIVCSLT